MIIIFHYITVFTFGQTNAALVSTKTSINSILKKKKILWTPNF